MTATMAMVGTVNKMAMAMVRVTEMATAMMPLPSMAKMLMKMTSIKDGYWTMAIGHQRWDNNNVRR